MSLLNVARSGWAASTGPRPAPPGGEFAGTTAEPRAVPHGGHVLAQEPSSLLRLDAADYTIVGVVLVVALAALVFGYVLIREVLAAAEGSERMREIARAVQEGASAYLNRQFRTLAFFAVVVFLLLFALPAETPAQRIGRSVFFLFGAAFSAAIGYLGMWLSTRANLRVAAAANDPTAGRTKAMRIAFRTGGVVGMTTIGLGLFGAALVVLVYAGQAPRVLEGFGFGAALLAMFMRVGGGIFTKAADVGADLVGKVEQNIPEDDPRNAATIADNVGDNVGDCAGMAADLFESYAVTLVASLILGTAAFGTKGLLFPLIVPAIGVITAVIGVYITKARAGEGALVAINRSFYLSAAIAAVACAIAALLYLPGSYSGLTGVPPGILELDGNPAVLALASVIIGIVLAVVILKLTGYFTATERRPVRDVGRSSTTGPATVILTGFSVGFESAVYTALVIAAAVFGAFLLSGSISVALFAVALAGCGLLTTVGVIVAMDTFGPVADNAQGIAEMSGEFEGEGADVLTELDAVGNTTKAITKGIAIATAVLAATALFGSYRDAIGTALADIGAQLTVGEFLVYAPNVLVGVAIGAAVVFLFAGLAINAVSRAAGAVVHEVRRQFSAKPGIMDGSERPEYGRVVDICTKDSLRELATPGLLAVLAPIAVGFGLGVGPLAGYLAGAIAVGTLMAIFLANSGGAWDNAKKLVEDGYHGGKGSQAHEATVIGDTVGDPFKDTAGPAINPLLKVMNLVSVLVAPAVVTVTVGAGASLPLRITIAVICFLVIAAAVISSKRRSTAIAESSGDEVVNGAK
ncbi:K(+)-stimulated pyrophosphate-energized sodium pump [Actinopolyspora xinjiangensis]|uniref:K(+)-insensitive pyrophosphate-energized proton pump n=1 Tax=Actinopolyspora xinjiangensis TaxID=405564 RepID=A0A1H0WX90_9ACTN|nr:sodium-translocating pyrophosphatase [Actinopolyspora xinjiangensis]SDP95321.1 K(+)-stimulated pyrophosphate-energized sodium pump [Actinopolyspora xinjiangensis]